MTSRECYSPAAAPAHRHPAGYSRAVNDVDLALRSARAPTTAAAAVPRRAIVAGAGGALGSAVLERLLADAGIADVAAVVDRPLAPSMRRLRGVPFATLLAGAAAADTAVVVFDRERGRHGREDVFHRPVPQALPALAAALQRSGVRRLVVVLPHAPATLPQALKLGLASLGEQAVAALGFEHLVFVRSAQRPGGGRDRAVPWLQRVADGVLAQLHWMVPLREQAVRADKVAAFVAALLRALPAAAPGTRIVPPEVVWQAAQPGDVDALVGRWLADGRVPVAALPRQRW